MISVILFFANIYDMEVKSSTQNGQIQLFFYSD